MSGFSLSRVLKGKNHGVGGSAFHGEFALGKLLAVDRLAQRE